MKITLVDYSSSDEGDSYLATSSATEQVIEGVKRKRDAQDTEGLPPLPSKFHDLYASTTRVSTKDDPSLHDGRKRVTPHVEGNWPTHLYIEWCPVTAEYTFLDDLISSLITKFKKQDIEGSAFKVNSFLASDLGAPLPLHISLSRPIGFLTEEKDKFVAALEQSINTSGIRPFNVSLSGLDWVANFDETRWFLVLRVQQPGQDGLNRLLHLANTVVQSHGQPPLYTKSASMKKQDWTNSGGANSKRSSSQQNSVKFRRDKLEDASDSFHISIAWSLKPPTQNMEDITKVFAKNTFMGLSKITVTISEIKAKVGNVVTNMALRRNALEGMGLFGS